MTTRLVMLIALAFPLLITGAVEAQEAPGLRIVVTASIIRADGGDRRSGGTFIDPDVRQRTIPVAISRLEGQCGTGMGNEPLGELGVASDGSMKKIDSAWTVHVTPLSRVDDAVTFRLRWTRTRHSGRPSTLAADRELTLRPGQSTSLDVMPFDGTPGASPGCVGMALGVEVAHHPDPHRDRRLVDVDLWLVERLPDGRERSQMLPLRGLYHQAIPFYFSTLTEGTKDLDLFGDLQVSPDGSSRSVVLTTRSRLADRNPVAPAGYPAGRNWPPGQYVGSNMATVGLADDEVVSVPLPAIDSPFVDGAAFSDRTLSFRIRLRQVR